MSGLNKTDAKPEPSVDDINLNGVSAQYIKLDLTGGFTAKESLRKQLRTVLQL